MKKPSHEDVATTDLFWIDGEMYWRIHLSAGGSVEISDTTLRNWLRDDGERAEGKISYRQFARYAAMALK